MINLAERSKKIHLIEKKRNELAYSLKSGLITENDIINLMKKDANYGVRIVGVAQNPKKAMLKNIFNCPFLLCDLDCLSLELKEILPYFLNARYLMEKDALKIYLEQGFIDEHEYVDELDNLKFYYYDTTNDGKCILETGHAFLGKEQIKMR